MRTIFGGALLILAACSRAPAETDSIPLQRAADSPSPALKILTTPPSSQVAISPSDLMTDIGETGLEIWTDNGSNAPDPNVLSFLLEQVQLRTYPELNDVPFTTSVHVPHEDTGAQAEGMNDEARQPSRSSRHPYRSGFSVIPKAALADRWYVLSLSALPGGATVSSQRAKEGLGVSASRFRPGSAPVLRRVSLCDKPSAERIVVELSEGIEQKNVGSFLRVGGDSCKFVSPGVAEVQQVLYFDCAANLRGTDSLTFVLKRGILSPGGEAVGVLNPDATSSESVVDTRDRNETLSLSGLTESSGCKDLMQWVSAIDR